MTYVAYFSEKYFHTVLGLGGNSMGKKLLSLSGGCGLPVQQTAVTAVSLPDIFTNTTELQLFFIPQLRALCLNNTELISTGLP
jgi:hypothetical protein